MSTPSRPDQPSSYTARLGEIAVVNEPPSSSRRLTLIVMSTSPTDFNAKIIDEFRANEGRVGGMFAGMPLLLLHHTGAKSGRQYVNPVTYADDDGRYVIFASKAGAPSHPAWYHNLKAHPDVQIELGTQTLDVHVSEAQGTERERLFRAQAERVPQFAEYEQKAAGRLIPVMILTPR
jgi:deazaflavin-dependent oxidoreductase (nitroreductase family)